MWSVIKTEDETHTNTNTHTALNGNVASTKCHNNLRNRFVCYVMATNKCICVFVVSLGIYSSFETHRQTLHILR